jgi:hypothetical protein
LRADLAKLHPHDLVLARLADRRMASWRKLDAFVPSLKEVSADEVISSLLTLSKMTEA